MNSPKIEPELTKCPVCGQSMLEHFEVCSICGWQNDYYQLDFPDKDGCANNMSLNEAREAYKKGERIH